MKKYKKVSIFPITKYMTAKERKQLPVPMIPVSFRFRDSEIQVDHVVDCVRGSPERSADKASVMYAMLAGV